MSDDLTEATEERREAAETNGAAAASAGPAVGGIPAQQGADPESPRPQADGQPTGRPARRKILIGSQRDPADRRLTPRKPKAVREAEKSVAEALQPEPDKPVPSAPPQAAPCQPEPAKAAAPEAAQPAAAPPELDQSSPPEETAPVISPPAEPPPPAAAEAPAGAAEPPPAEAPAGAAEPPAPGEAEPQPIAPDSDAAIVLPQKIDIDAPDDQLEGEIDAALSGLSLEQILAEPDAVPSAAELPENSRHKGTVINLHHDDVFFTLGGQHEGVVSLRQFKKPPRLGAMMDVVVKRFNPDDGLYELTIPGASVDVADWSDLTAGAAVEARVTGCNTGGLECMVNTIRGFIPASQIALFHVENMAEFIGQKLQCVVMEVNPRRRKLVLSHRAILQRQRDAQRQELLEQLEVGQVRQGVVRTLRDFGAFVDLGGVDGLIHISKLSWDRVEHPRDVLSEGQPVRVRIEKVNKQTGKIALSYRDLLEHPWDGVEQKYPAGSIVTGTISRIAHFGAFVKLEPGVEGMIHISELAHQRVASVSNVVAEGESVQVKVLSVDRQAQRIALSLKAIQPEPQPNAKEKSRAPAEQPARPLAVPPRKGPLKGGKDRPSGGEQFGLKW